MMRRVLSAAAFIAVVLLIPGTSAAEVLGPCGTADADMPQVMAPATGSAPAVSAIPLPGMQAPNFELDAVVGDEVKRVKLSDYDGKWRVVCFYPADFTFV